MYAWEYARAFECTRCIYAQTPLRQCGWNRAYPQDSTCAGYEHLGSEAASKQKLGHDDYSPTKQTCKRLLQAAAIGAGAINVAGGTTSLEARPKRVRGLAWPGKGGSGVQLPDAPRIAAAAPAPPGPGVVAAAAATKTAPLTPGTGGHAFGPAVGIGTWIAGGVPSGRIVAGVWSRRLLPDQTAQGLAPPQGVAAVEAATWVFPVVGVTGGTGGPPSPGTAWTDGGCP